MFETNLIGTCVVKGQTANFLLNINIAFSFIENLEQMYSVIPRYFLFKKVDFEIGPLISLFEFPFLIMSKATSNEFSIYLFDLLEIFSKGLFIL